MFLFPCITDGSLPLSPQPRKHSIALILFGWRGGHYRVEYVVEGSCYRQQVLEMLARPRIESPPVLRYGSASSIPLRLDRSGEAMINVVRGDDPSGRVCAKMKFCNHCPGAPHGPCLCLSRRCRVSRRVEPCRAVFSRVEPWPGAQIRADVEMWEAMSHVMCLAPIKIKISLLQSVRAKFSTTVHQYTAAGRRRAEGDARAQSRRGPAPLDRICLWLIILRRPA